METDQVSHDSKTEEAVPNGTSKARSNESSQANFNLVGDERYPGRWLNWLVGAALLAVLLLVASKNMIVDLDLFHEMALYRQLEAEGAMPRADAFAYTPTNYPVVHHEWATGAVLYQVCVSMGLGAMGVVLTKYLLTFGLGLGCYWYARRQSVPMAIFTLLVPVAINVGGWMAFTNVRAQLFTLFFLVVMLLLLDSDRKGGRWWIAIWLPLVIVWGNIHGGVVSGIGLIGCYGIARTIESWLQTRSVAGTYKAIWHLLATGVATAGLLNVSPYGWDYVPYLIRAIRMPRKLIPEWNPIWQLDTYEAVMFYGIAVSIALVGLFLFWQRHPATFSDAKHSLSAGGPGATNRDAARDSRPAWMRDLFTPLALALTAYMAAKHYRHGSLFAVTWLCLVPPLLSHTWFAVTVETLWKRRAKWIAVGAVATLVVCLGLSIRAEFWKLRVPGQKSFAEEAILVYPVGPVDYLAQHNFEGNLFVPFNLGAYVSWKLHPQVKVSIDSRYEVAYPPGALEENFLFYNAQGAWPATLEKYPTDAVLIRRSDRLAEQVPNLVNLDDGLAWKLVYQDQEFLMMVRAQKAVNLPFVDRSKDSIKGIFP